MNRWELHQKAVDKALRDANFKKKLLAHPKEALKELIKRDPSASIDMVTVKIVKEKKNEWIFPIPYIVANSENLSEIDIKNIQAGQAAGHSWCMMFTCSS